MTAHKRIVLDSQFRKAHSQLQQIIKLWQEQEDENLHGIYYHDTDGNGEALRSAFYSYIKGTPNGSPAQSTLKPYYTSAKGSTTTAHYCPISSCVHPYPKSFTSFDGTMYKVSARDGVLHFAVDINGYDKGPNKWGVDLFHFDYTQNNVLTGSGYGCSDWSCSTYYNKVSTHVNDGIGCTNCALKDKEYFKKIDL